MVLSKIFIDFGIITHEIDISLDIYDTATLKYFTLDDTITYDIDTNKKINNHSFTLLPTLIMHIETTPSNKNFISTITLFNEFNTPMFLTISHTCTCTNKICLTRWTNQLLWLIFSLLLFVTFTCFHSTEIRYFAFETQIV
jgi:hypothetical protein